MSARKRPMPRPEARRRAAPVIHLSPHPLVWAHALALAGHDVTRLQPQSDGTVLVLNLSRLGT